MEDFGLLHGRSKMAHNTKAVAVADCYKLKLKHKIMDLLKILFEKRHPNSCKCAVSGWVAYDLDKPETRPTKYGKYFVHRKDGKIHWETWNGSGWSYNGNVITFWMEVLPPCH